MNDASAMDLNQGDLRLLQSELAQRLLASTEMARLAYIALDGTPRVLPMLFLWNGEEVVMSGYRPSYKLAALRANPAVAISIDGMANGPEALLNRGEAVVTDIDGVAPDYIALHRRYYGGEQAQAMRAQLNRPEMAMARIAVRPTWVGLIDFRTRFPEAMPADLRG
jgi:hypothetical protein